jgi:hypothetical protein
VNLSHAHTSLGLVAERTQHGTEGVHGRRHGTRAYRLASTHATRRRQTRRRHHFERIRHGVTQWLLALPSCCPYSSSLAQASRVSSGALALRMHRTLQSHCKRPKVLGASCLLSPADLCCSPAARTPRELDFTYCDQFDVAAFPHIGAAPTQPAATASSLRRALETGVSIVQACIHAPAYLSGRARRLLTCRA